MRPTTIATLVAATAALFLTSCSEKPSTAPETAASVAPRTGSTYTMHRYDADTTGAPIPGSGDTVVATLAATGVAFAGQSSVSVFTQGADTVARLRYEASGDVLYYPNWAGARLVGWITLPIATKGSTERTLRDTTIDLGNGETGRNRVTLGVEWVSTQQVSVGAETIEAHQVRIRIIDVNPLPGGQSLTNTATHTVWFAPKLGYFTRVETGESQVNPYATFAGPVAVSVLTAYDLK